MSVVVSSANFEDLSNIVHLAHELGVAHVDFKRFRIARNGRKNFREFLLSPADEKALTDRVRTLGKLFDNISVSLGFGEGGGLALWKSGESRRESAVQGCPCGKSVATLTPMGDILPCVFSERSIGNILRDDLEELWTKNEVLRKMRNGETVCLAEDGM